MIRVILLAPNVPSVMSLTTNILLWQVYHMFSWCMHIHMLMHSPV